MADLNEQLEYLDEDVQQSSASGRPTYFGAEVTGSLNPIQAMGADVLQNALATKIQAQHIINHHGATQMFLANQAVAQHLGLPDKVREQVVPFPSPSKSVVINDNGSSALSAITSKLIDTLAQMAKPNESSVTTTIQTQPVQSGQLDTPQPVKSPDVLVMKVAPNTIAPLVKPIDTSFWTTIKNNSGVMSAILWALTVLGGGMAYWRSTAEPAKAITLPDVQGHVKVSVE